MPALAQHGRQHLNASDDAVLHRPINFREEADAKGLHKGDGLNKRYGKPLPITTFIAICGALLCCVASPAFARRKHAPPSAAPAPMLEARSASTTVMRMLATAYTAYCGGRCSGRTALGWAAGYGIVAVDPRVIPLRSRLYIPGYGYAVAGDTGGSIRGSRIDLGFNTYRDAREFGRRDVTVYILQ